METRGFGVLTLNIWNVNEPLDTRLEALARFLTVEEPEFVLLQEVSPIEATVESSRIAAMAGYKYHWYQESGEWEGRKEGVAILSKTPIEVIGTVVLPEAPDDMGRVAQRAAARVDESGHRVELVNTHLAFRPEATKSRVAQALRILEELARDNRRLGLPMVLGGDLNDMPESETLRTITSWPAPPFADAWSAMHPHQTEDTFSVDNRWAAAALQPGRRIDYILVSPGIRVQSCDIVLSGKRGSPTVSDHYGVMARCAHMDA